MLQLFTKVHKSIKIQLNNVKKNEKIRSKIIECQAKKFWRNFPNLFFVDQKTRFVHITLEAAYCDHVSCYQSRIDIIYRRPYSIKLSK